MMENWELLLMPLVGGIIGWITNMIAIKMLFWPKTPIKLPFLSWEFAGLLPKRHLELARSIGEIIERDLLPLDDLLVYFQKSGFQDHVVDSLAYHVDKRIQEKLPRLVPSSIKELITTYVQDAVTREANTIITQVAHSSIDKVKSELHLAELVEEKVAAFDLEQLESLIKEVTNTELKYIEYLGGIFGFLIGCVQVLLVVLIRGS